MTDWQRDEPPLRRGIAIMRRRKWYFIIPVVIVFLAPTLWAFFTMRHYEANSVVWLNSDAGIASVLGQSSNDQGSTPIQQEADTLTQLLQTRSFLTDVVGGTALQKSMTTASGRAATLAFLRKNIGTDVIGPNSLRITFSGQNPGQAVAVTRSITHKFMDWVRLSAHAEGAQSDSFFTDQVDKYRKKLSQARAKVLAFKVAHPGTDALDISDQVLVPPKVTVSPQVQSQYEKLKSQLEYTQQLYTSSLSDLAKTQALAAEQQRFAESMSVVDGPILPTTFAKKQIVLTGLLALLAALAIGVTSVVVAETGDRGIRGRREAQRALDEPVMSDAHRADAA